MDGTAVVTGASRGIGEAVARAFAAEGVTVFACARDADAIETVAEGIENEGGEAHALRADVRDEYDLERLMETATRDGDGIDHVVANAGIYHGTPGETPLAAESYAAFDDTLRTNVRGVYATIREASPHLTEDARVLVPTGAIARDPKPGLGSYAVSKAGAEAVVRGFATEIEQAVACLDPGQVSTELSGPSGRDPTDVAPMFVWAAGLDFAELDGRTLGLKEWRSATR
jgi:3-oxoacyl-[acyl-carrier protein] reductase